MLNCFQDCESYIHVLNRILDLALQKYMKLDKLERPFWEYPPQ